MNKWFIMYWAFHIVPQICTAFVWAHVSCLLKQMQYRFAVIYSPLCRQIEKPAQNSVINWEKCRQVSPLDLEIVHEWTGTTCAGGLLIPFTSCRTATIQGLGKFLIRKSLLLLFNPFPYGRFYRCILFGEGGGASDVFLFLFLFVFTIKKTINNLVALRLPSAILLYPIITCASIIEVIFSLSLFFLPLHFG